MHVWEKQELTFTAARSYTNPYTDVTVWVDLTGPNFKKRVYGFWDGGQTFRVRLVATAPGTWTWRSGSNPADEGLAGKTGSFAAIDWTEAEKQQNPLRRGFLRATANHHALEQADGTPFFVIGDTWYATGTNRFKWYDDDRERPIGPDGGIQGLRPLPQSAGLQLGQHDRRVSQLDDRRAAVARRHERPGEDHRPLGLARIRHRRFARTGSAKNMDNEGGRPFLFPGKVPGYENMFPDVDRINPEYFRYVDRKIDYLNEQGFVPFIEVSRRDASLLWKKYYGWPDSYARFIQYIWSRYQANNTVLSPIHLDIISESVGPDDYLAAIRVVMEKFGPPPFGTLLSANANPSTLENWGEDSWVTLHQTGNMREHNNYWYLTEIFNQAHPQPALNGEPYYSGYVDARGQGGGRGYKYGAPGGTEKDDQFVRSAMYGSFLSGGLAGHVYGAEGIWGADIEAGRADQDVGRLPVELRQPDAAPAHVRVLDRQALPGTGSACRPGLAEQDPRDPLLRGLGLLRPYARQEHLPGVFREGLSAQPGPRRQAQQHLPGGVVRSAQRHLAGRRRAERCAPA